MATHDANDVEHLMVVVDGIRYRREDAERLGILPVEVPPTPPVEPPAQPPVEPPADPPVDPDSKAAGAANKSRTPANKGA